MPEWTKEVAVTGSWSQETFPGVFDGYVFDVDVFDCTFTSVSEDGVTNPWVKESSL